MFPCFLGGAGAYLSRSAASAAIRADCLERAYQLLCKFIDLEPDHFEAWLLRGWTTRDPHEAAICFERALALEPGNAVAADALAWARGQAPKIYTPSPPVDDGPALTLSWLEALRQSTEPHMADVAGAHASTSLDAVQDTCVDDTLSAERIERPAAVDAPQPVVRAATPAMRFNRNRIGPLAYVVVLGLAEVLTVFIAPLAGLVLYGLMLVSFPVSFARLPSGPLQRLPLALALVPLTRMLSLSLPLSQIPFIYWHAIIGIPLTIAGFLVIRAAGYTLARVGLTARRVLPQLVVGLSGLGIGYLEFLILRPSPLIESFTWDQFLFSALSLFVFTGFLEEFLFRGILQRAYVDSLGAMGIACVAFLFAVLHLGYHSALHFAFVFGVGLYFGAVAMRSGSILGVTLAHGVANIGLLLIYPFLITAS